MAYTTAQRDDAASALVRYLPGLSLTVARAWVTAEQGVGNNPLGVTSGGKLVVYPTMDAGAKAAADLVKRSAYYSGIVRSLSGTPSQQAWAIVTSPWHLGPAGLAAAGGVDPYYLRVFTSQGINLSAQLGKVAGSTGTATTPTGTTPSTGQVATYHPPTTTAAADRVAVLEAAIATQTRNVAVNLAAGKTAAAATDQATLDRYKAELAGLLAAPKAAPLTTASGYSGPSLATALGSDPTLTTPTQVKQLADQLKAQGVGGANTTAGDLYAYLVDFIGQKASAVPFNFSGVTGADPTQNATKTGENTPIPGETGLAAVSGALGGLGDTAVQVFTYLLAVVVIGLGVFLYSKGGRPQEAPVGP